MVEFRGVVVPRWTGRLRIRRTRGVPQPRPRPVNEPTPAGGSPSPGVSAALWSTLGGGMQLRKPSNPQPGGKCPTGCGNDLYSVYTGLSYCKGCDLHHKQCTCKYSFCKDCKQVPKNCTC